ncbi:MAG: cell shape determination protein CcmA [Bacteroidetes bacterium HGW-Bacteroidetes-17]|jgi:cytoskeletal protein CcmA (bactofilin family)|nr:MAG: cell shape determination protein CcmA [Bacteroidetes bacterium HGW-Bacteroidetes-17]
MAKNGIVEAPSRNAIGNGTIIKGDIESNGDFRIDGELTGTIRTKGKVVIGSTGKIEGEVFCQNADVEGIVNANMTVSDLLTLKSTARLNGDVSTSKLAIEPGAQFLGSCKMGSNIKSGTKYPVNETKL